jgi:predicted TIM-barrel fold metal-dependent hydrolase
MLDAYAIDCAITFPGPSGLTGSPKQIAAANEAVAAAASACSGRIVAFGTVNPWHDQEAWAELDRLPSIGLGGLKLHPPTQGLCRP